MVLLTYTTTLVKYDRYLAAVLRAAGVRISSRPPRASSSRA